MHKYDFQDDPVDQEYDIFKHGVSNGDCWRVDPVWLDREVLCRSTAISGTTNLGFGFWSAFN